MERGLVERHPGPHHLQRPESPNLCLAENIKTFFAWSETHPRDCAQILTRLTHATIAICLKASTIIPIAKKAGIESLNDFGSIALISVVMKCIERIVSQQRLPTSLSRPLPVCLYSKSVQ